MVAIVRLGALLGLVSLGSCSQYLNMSRIENRIQDDIERQGRRLTLKDVICPNRMIKQAEAYFRCVGELPNGGQFTVNVIQQDDQGNVSWDVPSSKVLINLASLEEKIQAGTKEAVGKSLTIDCRDTYRVSQRGDSFECDVVGAGTVTAGRVDSVLVKVDGDGNLEWQEILIEHTPGAASGTNAAGSAASSASATPEVPAAKSADDKTDESAAAAKPASNPLAEAEEDADDDGDRQ
ncbi:hypothetical protein [Leptothoe spongobia]|nr:hypothetical protein [Leptothoe spongobia]